MSNVRRNKRIKKSQRLTKQELIEAEVEAVELGEIDHPWEVTPFMLQEKARLIALEERSHNYGYNPQTGKVERMRPTFDY